MTTITELSATKHQLRQTLVGSLLVSSVNLSANYNSAFVGVMDSFIGNYGGNLETYIFPADPDTGEVTDWGEVWGERTSTDWEAQHEAGIEWAKENQP